MSPELTPETILKERRTTRGRERLRGGLVIECQRAVLNGIRFVSRRTDRCRIGMNTDESTRRPNEMTEVGLERDI